MSGGGYNLLYMDLEDAFDEWETADERPDPETGLPVIDTPTDLPGYMALTRRIARVRHKIDEVEAGVAARKAALDAFAADTTAGNRRLLAELTRVAEAYQRATNRATVKTPYATTRLNAPAWSVRVVDEQAFIEWALRNNYPGLVRTKTEVARSVVAEMQHGPAVDPPEPGLVAELFLDEGEPVPGVLAVRPEHGSFTLTIAKETPDV